MHWFRTIVRRGLEHCDSLYRYRRGLTSVGPALYVGRVRYQGPPLTFADGTELTAGSKIGTLHFNNERLAKIWQADRHRTGLQFAKLMRSSLRSLAESAGHNAIFLDVQVYQGITWVRSHGERVGFQSTPLPEGWRKRLLSCHFRLITWAFSPGVLATSTQWEPRLYWLTRAELLRNFGASAARECTVKLPEFAHDGQRASIPDV